MISSIHVNAIGSNTLSLSLYVSPYLPRTLTKSDDTADGVAQMLDTDRK